MEKNKVEQLGGELDNTIKSQFTYNFEWTQPLGIEFDLCNFDRITYLNIEKKLSEMK